ncbi:hypothetical protein Pan258_29520 [Symmachiella dynata]|uniref:hypothetical protein n=1 Tax=Symmachiella dynata TaxID=2527995 RepID=UPI001187D160|nr:hypothetical protein [Symmachiella dynata]QDT48905.1 hypothetical protein Pan258_29520 [Symmachiella dynata]
MDDILKSNDCTCGLPDKWAANPEFPVEFDEMTNEYQLSCERSIAMMRYCFFCGGRLPDSKRGELFTTPSQEEKEEVQRLFSNAKTAEDALRMLGPPDETHEWDESATRGFENVVRWKQTLRYTSRWDSLILDVQEMPDGKISFVICGKYTGRTTHQVPNQPSRWWEFWKKGKK